MLFSLHAIYPFILHASLHFLWPPPLQSQDHTSLHHHTPPPCWSTSFPLLCFLIHFHLSFKYTYPPSLSTSPFSLFSHSFILQFSPFFSHLSSHPTPISLPVCSDRFCGSRAGCVNVKPFPAMIMFITHCGSRCPWINTNWGSTLQR